MNEGETRLNAYLASPFGFADSTRSFMNDVYVPALSQFVNVINPWDLTKQEEIDDAVRQGRSREMRYEIGKRNAEAIKRADIVIAALDGQELDSGTVAEIGFAAGLGKKIYGYRSDFRQAGELSAPFNPQVEYFVLSSGGIITSSLEELRRTVSLRRAEEATRMPRSGHEDVGALANFLFEVGTLAQSPRSFTVFLGSGRQSIAEHINRTTYIGFVLAMMQQDANVGKVILMCLFHDLAEARTSDLNYVNQKYVASDEEKVIKELAESLPFGERILEVLHEFKERKSLESKLAKDADQIEFILSLKEQIDVGNTRAKSWLPSALKRLKSPEAQRLAEKIVTTDSDEWWFSDKDSDWWIDRPGMDTSKRF